MSSRSWVSFFLLVLLASFAGAEEANLLNNGSFTQGLVNDIPVAWGTEYYNCSVVEGRSSGEKALMIKNDDFAASMGAQEISLDQNQIKKITVSCFVKGEKIEAGKAEPWMKGNLQVLFFDAGGKQLDGWPELGPWMGTFPWTKYARTFIVPKGTAKVKLVLGLNSAKGTIYFADVVLAERKKVADPYNLISNGDFAVWEDWAYGGSENWKVEYPSFRGTESLRITNEIPMWSFASQSIPLDGAVVKKIRIDGYMKVENVIPGPKPWQVARVNLEFKSRSGKRIGGWPIVESLSGTSDWNPISKTFEVPEGTSRVDLFAGLLECAGTVYFDDLRMEGYDKNGMRVKIGGEKKTNTGSWNKFIPPKSTAMNTPTDVSFLLDAPAGKHGFLQVKDGHFYFDDGARARFWGTNIYGASLFPSHDDAERIATRLAKAGCNLVRIHHLDAFWSDPNIFDKNFNDTQHLSAESVEKLDYLLYQLKQKGIYIFLDLLVDREFKEGDNVPDYQHVERGAKITGFYNKRIIELQKKYAYELLTHYNPYTRLKYVDDPAIVSYKLINEASLFYIGTQYGLSKVYLAELDLLFNEWLAKKYGSTSKLRDAWTDRYGRCDLERDEDLGRKNVKRAETLLAFQRGGGEKLEPLRVQDTMLFYYEVQNKYFLEMADYLKGLGAKVPISGSNHWVNIAADVASNATLDYIDRHRYWDHPQLSYGSAVLFEDQPMVKYPDLALPNNFAFYKVAGKPFVISEWNTCFPNEWRAEGPLIMAAYANLQDWDGVLQFSFNSPDWKSPLEDNFDISAWPNVWDQWPAAALLFHRGDVKAAKTVLTEALGPKDIFGTIYEDEPIAGDPLLPLAVKSERAFGQTKRDADTGPALKFIDKNKKLVKSETGELLWNYADGIFKIDTPKTQAAIGFSGGKTIDLGNAVFKPTTSFSSIALSSLTKDPLSSSAHILLTVSGRIENTDQVYNAAKTQLKEVGVSPLLFEGVSAKITIKTRKKPLAVYALDINGERTKKIKAAPTAGGITFNINAKDRAFFYEIAPK